MIDALTNADILSGGVKTMAKEIQQVSIDNRIELKNNEIKTNSTNITDTKRSNSTAKVVETLTRNNVEAPEVIDNGPSVAEKLAQVSQYKAANHYDSYSMREAAEATAKINVLY